jgi:hypothetical protein
MTNFQFSRKYNLRGINLGIPGIESKHSQRDVTFWGEGMTIDANAQVVI